MGSAPNSMTVPDSCTVLVIGGGPAGSFAAASLARDGIDTVILEGDKFPRYHIGESMLPSIRHFLRFIDCYDKFNEHGFMRKNGAAFKLNKSQPPAYTDFIASGGPGGYSWNVIRSEADEILFKHAEECGAHIFDATKVASIDFEDTKDDLPIGRPTSATWSRKDGSTGIIKFDYLVDASGRAGLLSTRYLKNRKFNQGLKNIANWAYWKGGGKYGVGEMPAHKEGSPFFEALTDGSGWTWFIPLHDGTHSIGVVQNQDMSITKKKALGSPSSKDFYMSNLELTPGIKALLDNGEIISDIKSASDWSYSAPIYALPNARIVGDAGAFIDPYFSSGVHMAVLGGVSAAVTICASIRGDCTEEAAVSWHTKKIAESYTRFFLVVSSATKQIRAQEDPVIQDIDEEGFQRAFDLFRPVIQGTADARGTGKLTTDEVSKTVEFCYKAFTPVTPEQRDNVVRKLESLGLDTESDDKKTQAAIDSLEKSLTPEEVEVLTVMRSRRLVRDDGFNIDSFVLNSVDGLKANMERGKLGLVKAEEVKFSKHQMYSVEYLTGKQTSLREERKGADEGKVDAIVKGLENLLASIKDSTSGESLDDESRHAVMKSLHDAATDMETPFDMIVRFANSGRLLPLVKVGIQLRLFKTLSNSETPLNVTELSKPTGADPILVTRIIRYLAANRLVTETMKNTYIANKATMMLAEEPLEGGCEFFFEVNIKSAQTLPAWLEQNQYKNIQGGQTVFHVSQNTELDLYPWLKTQPSLLKSFQKLMSLPRFSNWWTMVDFPKSSDSNAKVFVDVGGNIGHQSERLKTAHPELAGTIVVQDLKETVDAAPAIEGVQFMAHDFFTPNPVEGASYYYLRSILHNWEDSKAIEILKNIVPAMGPNSKILLDEMVIPDTGAAAWPAGQDLQMMMMFGAVERTEGEWKALIDRAGLKVTEIKTYAAVERSSIIFAELK